MRTLHSVLAVTMLLSLTPAAASAKTVTAKVKIGGAKTEDDKTRILNEIRALKGISSLNVTLTAAEVTFEDRTVSKVEIENAVQRAGFEADGMAPDTVDLRAKRKK